MTLEHELTRVGFPFGLVRLGIVCRFLINQDVDRLSDLAGFPPLSSLDGVDALTADECEFSSKVAVQVRVHVVHTIELRVYLEIAD